MGVLCPVLREMRGLAHPPCTLCVLSALDANDVLNGHLLGLRRSGLLQRILASGHSPVFLWTLASMAPDTRRFSHSGAVRTRAVISGKGKT